MAGAQIATNVTIINSLKGFIGLSFTEFDTTNLSAIAAGSVVEIGGAVFEFALEEAISNWTTVTTAQVAYCQLTPSGTAGSQIVTAAWSNSAPVWVASKAGWYESAGSVIRVVGSAFKTSDVAAARKSLLSGTFGRTGGYLGRGAYNTTGGAVGEGAGTTSGGAVGASASAGFGGGAVGSGASTGLGGGAVGGGATCSAGGAVGASASATTGGAVGNGATETSGGGAVGSTASATTGGAVGNGASATTGGAVGNGAVATSGGAVGSTASATSGGAVGASASATAGGAVGSTASATTGGAVGDLATTSTGGAVGSSASASSGGAVGNGAVSVDGFAGGDSATANGANRSAIGQGCVNTVDNSIRLGKSGTTSYLGDGTTVVTSDRRDKTDIEDNELGIDFIRKIRTRKFKFNPRELYWKRDDEGRIIFDDKGQPIVDEEAHAQEGLKRNRWHRGVIAQEFEKVVDGMEFSAVKNFDMTTEGANQYAFDYMQFIPVLIKAVQEQQSQIEELKAIIQGLTK